MTARNIVAALLENDDDLIDDPKEFIMNPDLPKSIKVVGRRWFRRGAGGTYHVADIYVNDELLHTTPYQYGYGDQYLETATQWLEHEGIIPMRPRGNGSCTAGWRWIRDELGIPLDYYAFDVKRQRDL
jgi:hypothetical protein